MTALATFAVACGGSTEQSGAGGKDAGSGGSGALPAGGSGGSVPSGGAGGIAPSGGGASGFGGSGALGGVGGTPGTECAGLDYCSCKANQACTTLSEPCFCPCGVEPCEPSCTCACGGGKYLGCAPASLMNPGALDGIWLVGWIGDLNHFSWVRFDPNGTALFNAGSGLAVNAPYWNCSGQGSWNFAQKPDTVFMIMPPSCNPATTVLSFTAFTGKPDYPKGCLLEASLETNPATGPLIACKFPPNQCDSTMTSCGDPL